MYTPSLHDALPIYASSGQGTTPKIWMQNRTAGFPNHNFASFFPTANGTLAWHPQVTRFNLWFTINGFNTNPGINCNSADIMITKTSVNLQTASGRMLEMVMGWGMTSGAGGNPPLLNATLVLRSSNGTLPSFTEKYDPYNDVEARLIWTACPTTVCSGGKQSLFIAHDNAKTVLQETFGNDLIISAPDINFHAPNQNGFQSVLNFTGPTNFMAGNTNVTSTNSASSLQMGQDYYILVLAKFNTTTTPCSNCGVVSFQGNTDSVEGSLNAFGIWSVPSSCSDAVNKVACSLPTPQPVFQFNPLDPSSWGNAIIKGLVWAFTVAIGQALFVIYQVVLPLMITGMNVIGNFVGLGNIGTDIATFLGFWIQFFTNQLPSAFNNLGTLFARWFDSLAILFAWVPIMLAIALNILGLGVSAISFLLLVVQDIFILWDTMIVLLLILFWFADIGEYGLAGFQAWFETMKYLVFGLGMKPLLETIHYGTDVILLFVGLVPKPIIQIAAKFDTIIPSIDISGSPTWPSFRMDEVREGNYFAILGFLIGLVVLIWFETTNLPGSITALVPGVGTTLTRDAPLVNLFLMFLEIFGFVALFILPGQMFKGIAPVGLPGVSQLQFRRGPSVQVSKVSTGFRRREPGRILLRAQKKLAESKTKVAQKPSAQGVG